MTSKKAAEAKQIADISSTSLNQHLNDMVRHVTAEERNNWNNKVGSSDVQIIMMMKLIWLKGERINTLRIK